MCTGRNVGKVGTGQFYCWDCYIEFALSAGGLKLYRVESDGELSRVEGPDTVAFGVTG